MTRPLVGESLYNSIRLSQIMFCLRLITSLALRTLQSCSLAHDAKLADAMALGKRKFIQDHLLDFKVAMVHRRSLDRLNLHLDLQFALQCPFVGAGDGRNVGVIAAGADFDVGFVDLPVVRRVQGQPADGGNP
jgi:hypothetical protein